MANFTSQGKDSPVKSREKGLLAENNNQELSGNCQETGLSLIKSMIQMIRQWNLKELSTGEQQPRVIR